MKIEQIQQVIAVYRAGSINKAAQELYLAQSTLSSSIRAIEQELRQPIFVRSPGGIELTDFGRSFVRYGSDILNAHQKILAAGKQVMIIDNALTNGFQRIRGSLGKCPYACIWAEKKDLEAVLRILKEQ